MGGNSILPNPGPGGALMPPGAPLPPPMGDTKPALPPHMPLPGMQGAPGGVLRIRLGCTWVCLCRPHVWHAPTHDAA